MSALLGLREILPWAGTCWYWAAPRLVLESLSSSALSSWSSIINTGTITIQLIWISRELKYNLTWSILMINKIWGVQSQLQAYHRFVVPIPDFHFSLPCNFLFPFLLHYFATIWEQFRGYRRGSEGSAPTLMPGIYCSHLDLRSEIRKPGIWVKCSASRTCRNFHFIRWRRFVRTCCNQFLL